MAGRQAMKAGYRQAWQCREGQAVKGRQGTGRQADRRKEVTERHI